MSSTRQDPPPSTIEVREIDYDSPSYRMVMGFRDRILRQPLGLQLTEEDTAGENSDRHFVISSNGRICGGVIARSETKARSRLRQMWIEPDVENRGLGRQLLSQVLQILRQDRVHEVTLHARAPVLGFYEKCGFHPVGELFEEVGIPHRMMIRSISPETQSPGDHR